MSLINNVSPFFAVLPPEIREEIYRYFVGKYAIREHDMRSREYNEDRASILRGGDYTFDFDFTILEVNHQIRNEALAIFQREHTFIRTSFRFEVHQWLYATGMFSALDSWTAARSFLNVSLDIVFGESHRITSSTQTTRDITFPVQELGRLCALINEQASFLQQPTLRIKFASDVAQQHVDQLLGPLQTIREMYTANIDNGQGQASTAFDALMALMYNKKMTAGEVVRNVAIKIEDAARAFGRSRYREMINIYKKALNAVHSAGPYAGYHAIPESLETIVGGSFDGKEVGAALEDLKIQAHTQIAQAHLHLGQYRMARIYTERIYSPLATVDHKHRWCKFPLKIERGSPAQYAKLLAVAAQISRANGHINNALDELNEARNLNPQNNEVLLLEHQYFKLKFGKRFEKRMAIDARRCEKEVLNHEATLQIALGRALAAENALEAGNLLRAQYKYAAAVQKAHDPLLFCWMTRSPNLCIPSRLAITANKMKEYKDAIGFAEHVISNQRSSQAGWGSPVVKMVWNPNLGVALREQAIAFEALGDGEEAIRTLTRGLDGMDGSDQGLVDELLRLVMIFEIPCSKSLAG